MWEVVNRGRKRRRRVNEEIEINGGVEGIFYEGTGRSGGEDSGVARETAGNRGRERL